MVKEEEVIGAKEVCSEQRWRFDFAGGILVCWLGRERVKVWC